MWKAPYRPRQSEISQIYNDGLVDIYQVTDAGKPGYQPVPQLKLKGTLAFEERQMGLQRFYSAKQNQIQVEKVLRVPSGFVVTSQDVAIIRGTEIQYQIDMVQKVANVYPASLDLTLAKVIQVLPVTGGGESEPG